MRISLNCRAASEPFAAKVIAPISKRYYFQAASAIQQIATAQLIKCLERLAPALFNFI